MTRTVESMEAEAARLRMRLGDIRRSQYRHRWTGDRLFYRALGAIYRRRIRALEYRIDAQAKAAW